jgi:hypothetical protein
LTPRYAAVSRQTMAIAKTRNRFAGLVLSLLLVAVETGALAHEIEHHLKNTDQPCAQCLFVNHHGAATAAVVTFSPTVIPEAFPPALATSVVLGCYVSGYAARAPPIFSDV